MERKRNKEEKGKKGKERRKKKRHDMEKRKKEKLGNQWKKASPELAWREPRENPAPAQLG